MDNYEAAQLQAEALEKAKPWYERPFDYFQLGIKWVLSLFLFISITHDVVKYLIDNWGK